MSRLHFIRVSEDSTKADIAEAIGHLRRKSKHEPDEWVRDALAEDVDELLELWTTA